MTNDREKSAPGGPQIVSLPRSARLRLLVGAVAFLAWIGFLAYLVATASRPIVLSRPQLLVSNLDVIAQVGQQPGGGPDPAVKVVEVYWPKAEGEKLQDQTVKIENLADVGAAQGWQGPGLYILPLTQTGRDEDRRWRVTPTPPAPGLHSSGQPRIYLATSQSRQQLETIQKPGS